PPLHRGSFRKKPVLIRDSYLIFRVEEPLIKLIAAMQKKVIVLGGSSGIGEAVAERFAKEGWLVIVGANDLAATQSVVNGLEGAGHIAVEIDITSESQIAALKKKVEEKFGSFNTLINSIGISKGVPLIDSDFNEWDSSMQVMLYGAVKACRALIPLIENGGRIIHITSIHYERVANGSSAYGMAKAAITQLT